MTTEPMVERPYYAKILPGETPGRAIERVAKHAVLRGMLTLGEATLVEFSDFDGGTEWLVEIVVLAPKSQAAFERWCPPTWSDREWTDADDDYWFRTKDQPSTLKMHDWGEDLELVWRDGTRTELTIANEDEENE